MKLSQLYKFFGATVIVTTLAVGSPLNSVLAQTTDPTSPTTPSVRETLPVPANGTDNVDYRRNDFDWGWLGLIGLLGLAGLAGRKNRPTTTYKDADDVTTTTYRRN